MDKLRIGEIPYANLFPIFHTLRTEFDCGSYEFVEGYPSALNRMLRSGEIDVSPSSSIEYLMDMDNYTYLEGHSISSRGPIGSILLFSHVPIGSLGGLDVHATHQSETSTALLKVILSVFYGVECDLKITLMPFDEAIASCQAYLSIGDEALLASGGTNLPPHVYDLGRLWHEHTGLPFVFALWIAKKEMALKKRALFERFGADLDDARRMATGRLSAISELPGGIMPSGKLANYWKGICYDLPGDCIEGLFLFREHLQSLGLLG
jgi:chorismate dehydratase